MMKKFQSFKEVSNYLSTEEVPFTDNKDEIIRNIDIKTASSRTTYRKLTLVFTVILILITSVAFAYDRIYGYMKKHEIFVESHDGEIKEILTDDEGNIVVQIGTMSREQHEKFEKESQQRPLKSKEFKRVYEELEKKILKDKIALFIPVKNLESFSDFEVLNDRHSYDTFEAVIENLPSNSPIPKYIPEGLEFIKAEAFYRYDYLFSTDDNYLNGLFEEAKNERQDYYYKEYTNLNKLGWYYLDFRGIISLADEKKHLPSIHMALKKGETTDLIVKNPDELVTEIIEYNGKKYLKEGDLYYTYYTYVYIDNELWTITIRTGLSIDEISKIIEGIEAK